MGTVIMPKMGDAMEEGTLLKWLKAAGDEVAEGDPIAEIETDKVTLEIEAQEDGFLTNVLIEEGTTAAIGTVIATIGTEDEIGQCTSCGSRRRTSRVEAAPEPAPEPAAAAAAPVDRTCPGSQLPPLPRRPQVVDRAPGERLRASPLVKRLAEEHGIDLGQVAGTGLAVASSRTTSPISSPAPSLPPGPRPLRPPAPSANGQVAPAAPAPAAASGKGTLVELSRMRRTTGKRMTESKLGIPHYYVTIQCGHGGGARFPGNNQCLTGGHAGSKVSVNDLIVKAAALALRDHPEVNTSFENGDLYQHDAIDINIAIALDGGLIAPFVPAADTKSLGAIARLTRDLGKRAREGGLTPEEYQGGTFTISNLGMFDVDEFIAVINPPQAAILAVGSVAEVPVVKDGKVEVGQVMKITLSADHRALDGAQVATFLQSVKGYLENPMLLAVS